MHRSFDLREIMRRWPTGVAIVTTQDGNVRHGMTVNSFVSVSLEPAAVTVTMANSSHTRQLVERTGLFAVNILDENSAEISDTFAGRVPETQDRFEELPVFSGLSGLPLLADAIAQIECKVIHRHEMLNSTLYIGEVLHATVRSNSQPLVYLNREYWRIKK